LINPSKIFWGLRIAAESDLMPVLKIAIIESAKKLTADEYNNKRSNGISERVILNAVATVDQSRTADKAFRNEERD